MNKDRGMDVVVHGAKHPFPILPLPGCISAGKQLEHHGVHQAEEGWGAEVLHAYCAAKGAQGVGKTEPCTQPWHAQCCSIIPSYSTALGRSLSVAPTAPFCCMCGRAVATQNCT